MKDLLKKAYNKLSVVIAVVCFFIMACEAETDEGLIIQVVAALLLGLLLFINRKKWLTA